MSLVATSHAYAQDTDLAPSAPPVVGRLIAPPSTLLNSQSTIAAPRAPSIAGGTALKPSAAARLAPGKDHGAKAATRKPLPDDQFGGTVTTDAVTLAGRDFFTWFARTWGDIPLSERYVVAIHERPSGRYGSLIWVEYQQKRVFQTFLPIARANVRPVAESAANLAFQTVIQGDLSNLLFQDKDMAKDEI
ncbi:CsgE family curli-type amyloid fiber assembly protein [Paraburkholderia sp. J67]|uniref:CsgE family curli-type amyloid fiber assembly protein n=1 Tax=Paraburkholderia sp. J67 TaxID=2805435 RepID=UPI002ABD511D|nr:CsgE family curli-type amyloid fiber assembly protein [Paraburkholderia sp. J67]